MVEYVYPWNRSKWQCPKSQFFHQSSICEAILEVVFPRVPDSKIWRQRCYIGRHTHRPTGFWFLPLMPTFQCKLELLWSPLVDFHMQLNVQPILMPNITFQPKLWVECFHCLPVYHVIISVYTGEALKCHLVIQETVNIASCMDTSIN